MLNRISARLWRVVPLFIATLFAVLSLAADASAARLVVKELRWRQENASNVLGQRDTLYNAIGVGETDTSVTFGINNWAVPGVGGLADSTFIGWIIIAQDSSTAATPTATSATINIDQGSGRDNAFTTTGAVTLTDFTLADKVIRIPLYIGPSRGVPGTTGHIAPALRLRIVAIGGVFQAARMWLVHLAEPPQ